MKLLVLINLYTNEVIAMSESKKDMQAYYRDKNFDNTYVIIKVKKEKDINVLLYEYEDLYLEHDELFNKVLTRAELKVLEDQLMDEKSRIVNTIKDIEHFVHAYSLSNEQKKTLIDARETLLNVKKKKNIFKILRLDYFLQFIQKQKRISVILNEYVEKQRRNMDNIRK